MSRPPLAENRLLARTHLLLRVSSRTPPGCVCHCHSVIVIVVIIIIIITIIIIIIIIILGVSPVSTTWVSYHCIIIIIDITSSCEHRLELVFVGLLFPRP